MHLYETEILIENQIEPVFEFLTTPTNIQAISPPDMGLKFLEVPEQYQMDSIIHFAVQNMGQVQEITHTVCEFEPPQRFVEELTKGPLPLWKHTHLFEQVRDGQTKVTDRIEFEPPGGLLGFLLTKDRILNSLEEGFYYRHQKLKSFLEA